LTAPSPSAAPDTSAPPWAPRSRSSPRATCWSASYLNGAPLAGDGGGFSGGGGGVGYRGYDGAVYAGLEASFAALFQRSYDFDGDVLKGKWKMLPQLTGKVGTKLGPFDLGLHLSGPIFTVGLSLGIEFTEGSRTSDPAARSRAAQEKARQLRQQQRATSL
jgi:hypothetical protein